MKKNGNLTLQEERTLVKALKIVNDWLSFQYDKPESERSEYVTDIYKAHLELCHDYYTMLEDGITEAERMA